jgi:signal transduction histidine kinase
MDSVTAIHEYAKRIGERAHFKVEFSCVGNPHILDRVERIQLFSIVRESLANVERHANAQRVQIRLLFVQDGLMLRIIDDGSGFSPEMVDHHDHYGLKIVEERTKQLNGKVTIQSQPNVGTQVSVYLPLKPEMTTASATPLSDLIEPIIRIESNEDITR